MHNVISKCPSVAQLSKSLVPSSKTKHKVEGGLFLYVVVAQSAAILQLLSSKDETLLVWGNAFFVLDLGFDIIDGVTWFNFKSDGLPSKCLHKNLHTSSKTENKVKGGLFLDVVVTQSAAIFQLLSSKDETLLVWGNAFFVLDLSFDIIDGVTRFNFKSDGLPGKCLHKNLHTSSKTENKVKGGLFLDVVVTQSAAIFQLLTSEDESLLVWGNAFFVLDLSFDIIDGVAWFNFKSDGLPSKCLHKNLHTSSKTEDKVKGGLFLDVVVTQSAAIFKLLSGENETLLVWGNAFFVLDLSFDVIDGIAWFNFKSDCFSGKCLDENLHASSKTENKMKGGLFLDVVVTQSAAVFKLLSGENETLLVWGNAFFVLDLSFDVIDGIAWFNFKSDCFSGKCLDEDLHLFSF